MDISSILTPECVLYKHSCTSKKRLIEIVASHLCDQHTELDPGNVFSALIAREKLGSTGIGHGIAIPHCRIPGCQSTIGVMVTLETPIDFDAIDSEPVDIIFVLVVPEDNDENHLQTLATLAKAFSDTSIQKRLRASKSSTELYNIITH